MKLTTQLDPLAKALQLGRGRDHGTRHQEIIDMGECKIKHFYWEMLRAQPRIVAKNSENMKYQKWSK